MLGTSSRVAGRAITDISLATVRLLAPPGALPHGMPTARTVALQRPDWPDCTSSGTPPPWSFRPHPPQLGVPAAARPFLRPTRREGAGHFAGATAPSPGP